MPDKQIATLPSFDDLVSDKEIALHQDQFKSYLNVNPPDKWVKTNKFAGNSKYIPIDKVEYLLDCLLGQWKAEVISVGQLFNAVYTHIRLHYLDPVTGEWKYHDGVGACQIQTAAGASPADLGKINNNAVQMALPASKSYAIKDAAEHLGKLFGRDLNRKETMPFDPEINKAFKESVSNNLKSKFSNNE